MSYTSSAVHDPTEIYGGCTSNEVHVQAATHIYKQQCTCTITELCSQ